MSICYACKKGIDDSAKFCRFCGAVQICKHCGNRVAPGAVKKVDVDAVINAIDAITKTDSPGAGPSTCLKCGQKQMFVSWKVEGDKVKIALTCGSCGFTFGGKVERKDLKTFLKSSVLPKVA